MDRIPKPSRASLVDRFNAKKLGQGIVLLVLIVLSGRLGLRLRVYAGFSTGLWMPSGVALSALVLIGSELWPWIFAGSFLLTMITRHLWIAALFSGAGASLEAWFGAYLLQRYSSRRFTFATIPEVLIFVLGIMLLAGFLSSNVEVFGAWLAGAIPGNRFLATVHTWWVGQAMANLIIAGFAISFWSDTRHRLGNSLRLRWDAPLVTLGMGLASAFIYSPLAKYNSSLIIRPYFLFTLMIWAVLRYDTLGATMCSLMLAVSSVFGALFGYLPDSPVPIAERMILNQYFAAAYGIVGLVTAAAIREKLEALEVRNEFLSIASHELKTPVTSIRLVLDLIRRDFQRPSPERTDTSRQHDLVERAYQQTGRLARIIEQLLNVSRIDRRDIALNLDTVHPDTVIANVLERLADELQRAHCTVSVTPRVSLGAPCQWDLYRVEQILENILGNVVKYAPGCPVRIELLETQRDVEIVIHDAGPGIEPRRQRYIFERFVRAHASHNSRGLGLGLYITRQLVEAHAGRIWVVSSAGKGTAFHVRLPILPPPGAVQKS